MKKLKLIKFQSIKWQDLREHKIMLTNEELDKIIDSNNLLGGTSQTPQISPTPAPTEGLRGSALLQSLKTTASPIAPIAPIKQADSPGFFGRLKERFGHALEEKEIISKKEDEDKINKVAEFLGKAGVDASIVVDTGFDALFSGIKNLGKLVLPKKAEQSIQETAADLGKKFLESESGKSVLEILEAGEEEFKKLEQTHPSIAESVKGLAKISELIPSGKAVGLAKKPIKPLARAGAGKIERQLVSQIGSESLEIIKPKLSNKEIANALEAGKGVTKGKIPLLGKVEIKPSLKDFEVAKSVGDVVSTRKNFVDNITAIRGKIATLAKSTDEGLKNNDVIFNNKRLKSFLNDVKEDSRIIFGSDKALENNYNAVIDEVFKLLSEKKNKVSDLLQVRRDFDKIVKQKFPRIFEVGSTDVVRSNAVLDVRRGVNDFIEELLPEGNEFKPLLKEQSLMYQATKNIAKKNAEVVNMGAASKVMNFLRQNPVTHGLTGGIITFGALGAILSNPILLGSAAILGTIKIGEKIITSKSLKQGLIKILRAIEGGKVKASTEIKESINEIINKL